MLGGISSSVANRRRRLPLTASNLCLCPASACFSLRCKLPAATCNVWQFAPSLLWATARSVALPVVPLARHSSPVSNKEVLSEREWCRIIVSDGVCWCLKNTIPLMWPVELQHLFINQQRKSLSGGFLDKHQSATTLRPLTAKVKNTDLPALARYFPEKTGSWDWCD